MQLLDVLVCNLANKPSFQNPIKSLFTQCTIDGILAELQVKMSGSCRFLLFLPHKYQVTLMIALLPDFSRLQLKQVIFSSVVSDRSIGQCYRWNKSLNFAIGFGDFGPIGLRATYGTHV